MAFCSNCGTQVNAEFCAKCGARTGGAPPPPGDSLGISENVAAALCYSLFFLLSGVLFLVLAPYNRNRVIRFHAFQALFTGLAWIVLSAAVSLISVVLLPIPFLGAAISVVLHLGVGLAFLFLWLMLMYKAYNRELWVLPVIGPLAEKQAYA